MNQESDPMARFRSWGCCLVVFGLMFDNDRKMGEKLFVVSIDEVFLVLYYGCRNRSDRVDGSNGLGKYTCKHKY